MSKKKAADYATPRIAEKTDTPAQKVAVAQTHIAAVKNSTDYPSAPEVQVATNAWDVENKNLAASNTTIADLESKLAKARTDQRSILRRWEVRKRGVLNAVNAYCDGSKDKVQGFNFAVTTRTAPAFAVVPEGLLGVRGKTVGTATLTWETQTGANGYLVQYATDPANPATYSQPISCTKGKFVLPGQTPGAMIHFRVTALDPRLPAGQTDYSDWLAVRVSS